MSLKRKLILAAVLVSANADASEEVEKFFSTYKQLGNSFDSKVAELYSDEAKVKTTRAYPAQMNRDMVFAGAQWKGLLRRIMPQAKAANDQSLYSNEEIEALPNGFKIKANRYSTRKCYTDSQYYMIVERVEGKLQIVEEFFETQALSSCK